MKRTNRLPIFGAYIKKAWTYRPTSEAYVDGDHNYPAWDSEMGEPENPVAAINSDLTGYRREKRVNFNGSLTLTYDIPGVKGLNAKSFFIAMIILLPIIHNTNVRINCITGEKMVLWKALNVILTAICAVALIRDTQQQCNSL